MNNEIKQIRVHVNIDFSLYITTLSMDGEIDLIFVYSYIDVLHKNS